MKNRKLAYGYQAQKNSNVSTTLSRADYNLWTAYVKHILRGNPAAAVPVLNWDNYHSWTGHMRAVLGSLGLLPYIRRVATSGLEIQISSLAASLIRSRISAGILSSLSWETLDDAGKLWVALEEELVPKGVAVYLECSVALRDGQKDSETDEGWEFRRVKLEEERLYCGVSPSRDLEVVVRLMCELGEEYEGLKRVWLGMEVEDLTGDVVELMVEGWILGLCEE